MAPVFFVKFLGCDFLFVCFPLPINSLLHGNNLFFRESFEAGLHLQVIPHRTQLVFLQQFFLWL